MEVLQRDAVVTNDISVTPLMDVLRRERSGTDEGVYR